MIKISTGLVKGKKLHVPRGLLVRPTANQVREAFFDIIGDTVVNSRFLDLFAGTGAMGIEALSRGALRATFVEKSSKCVKCIKSNLALCKFCQLGEVIQADAVDVIRSLANRQHKFDVIYLDPPYSKSGLILKILCELVKNQEICMEEAVIGVEHAKKVDVVDHMPPFVKKSGYTYGDTTLSFYTMMK